jgi:hypothetical protein
MKTKIIEMYRPSQYKSWEVAHDTGGVYAAQVPEDTPYDTIAALVKGTRICMSADDLVAWRIKPVELTPFQKAFIKAYQDNVGVASAEQVEEFLRDPDANPRNMMDCEYYKLIEAYDMFVAGSQYDSRR